MAQKENPSHSKCDKTKWKKVECKKLIKKIDGKRDICKQKQREQLKETILTIYLCNPQQKKQNAKTGSTHVVQCNIDLEWATNRHTTVHFACSFCVFFICCTVLLCREAYVLCYLWFHIVSSWNSSSHEKDSRCFWTGVLHKRSFFPSYYIIIAYHWKLFPIISPSKHLYVSYIL